MNESSPLSDRERDILRLVATGATNQQIAYQLNISVNTVKVHLRNIFSKIGAASRTEAALYAIREGIVSVEERAATLPPEDDTLAPIAEGVVPVPEPIPSPAPVQEAPPTLAPPEPAPVVVEPVTPVPMPVPAPKPASGVAWQQYWPFIASGLLILLLISLSWSFFNARTTPEPISTAAPLTNQVDRWRARESMQTPRSEFAVVSYDYDGKLYVIGGQTAISVTGTVERFDPENNLWASLNDKPTAASHVQAAVLRGLIIVPGGEDFSGSPIAKVEAFDPRTKTWTILPDMPQPRSRYGLAAIEGRLYVFGGWDGSQVRGEVFIYDPRAEKWSEGTIMPTPRESPGAAVLGGRAYIIGGSSASGPSRVNEIFDPTVGAQGAWNNATPLPRAIQKPIIAGLVNTVLLFDPNTRGLFQYRNTTDAWTALTVPEETASPQGIAVQGTSLYLLGGLDAKPNPGSVSEYRALYTTFLPGVVAK